MKTEKTEKKVRRRQRRVLIRHRLLVTNFLMVLAPVVIAVVILLAAWLIIWMWSLRNAEGRFKDNKDLYTACQDMDDDLTYRLEDESVRALSDGFILYISGRVADSQLAVLIENSDGLMLEEGDLGNIENAESLLDALYSVGGIGFVSDKNNAVYGTELAGKDGTFRVYMFGSQMSLSYHRLRIITYIVIAVAILTVIGTAVVTNRFVTDYIVKKIQNPVDALTVAVGQLQSGNLDYRIDYEQEDEFAPICDEFNRMTEQLQVSTERLEKQEEGRKELLASISHDLRSPLTTISAYTDGLIDGVAATEEARQRYLSRIKDRTADMVRLVNRLFVFAKLDMDEYPIELRPVQLDREIRRFVDTLSLDGETENMELRCADTVSAPVLADTEQLRNIMMNIIGNSEKYRNKPTGHLVFSVTAENNGYCLRAADNGPGVQEEELERIFDVFYRGDPARKNPGRGSGLGLAIVSKAVQRMNGMVSAKNLPAGGLEISVWLPALPDGEK